MVAAVIILLFIGYAIVGVLVAPAFAFKGVVRVDESAVGSSLMFRLLIVPGAAALWPIVLRKWMAAGRGGGA